MFDIKSIIDRLIDADNDPFTDSEKSKLFWDCIETIECLQQFIVWLSYRRSGMKCIARDGDEKCRECRGHFMLDDDCTFPEMKKNAVNNCGCCSGLVCNDCSLYIWQKFLNIRAEVIDWMKKEQSYNDESIARLLSMNRKQVEAICTRDRSLDALRG